MMIKIRGTRYTMKWYWRDIKVWGHRYVNMDGWRFDALALGPLSIRRWRKIR